MRYGPDDKFWCVTDPGPNSELGDVCFETSIRSLLLQVKGGLSIESNPTIFDDRRQAEADALSRLVAMRAARAIAAATPDKPLGAAKRVVVLDGDDGELLRAELR